MKLSRQASMFLWGLFFTLVAVGCIIGLFLGKHI